MRLSNLLDEKKLANGLPSIAYTDSEFWQMECETVLANNWTFVGFAHELKEYGDVLPISVAEKAYTFSQEYKWKYCCIS